jgi:hypothetical protein
MTRKAQTAIETTSPVPEIEMEPLNNSNQTFYSWSLQEIGTVLQGKFIGVEPSKYEGTDNYVLEIDDKQIKFAASAGLRSLEDAQTGAVVRITHLGMRPSKNGKQYRSFDIQIQKGMKKQRQSQVTS